MKTILLSLLLCFPILLTAQSIDSTAIRQVDSLLNIVDSYGKKRAFDKAFELLAAAEQLALSDAHGMGRETAAYGKCCHDHGWLFSMDGAYPEAETWYLKALAIREKVFGKDHEDYAATLSELASVYLRMGNFEKAEPMRIELVAIKRKLLGVANPQYCGSIVNLGLLYFNLRNFEKAERLFLEAKEIFETRLENRTHPFYATCLDNLGALYATKGELEKAEPLFLDALKIREKVLGKENHYYCSSLLKMGHFYVHMHKYEAAEQLLTEARALIKSIIKNPAHFIYRGSLSALGELYYLTGNDKKCESVMLEEKAIQETEYGKNFEGNNTILERLGSLYQTMGKYEEAGRYFEELAKLNQHLNLKALHHLSTKELGYYLANFYSQMYRMMSLAQLTHGKTATAICYDNCLFYKGFLLNAVEQIRKLANANEDAREKFERLKSNESLLATEYAKPIQQRSNIEALEEQVNQLEKDLSQTVAGFGATLRQVSWEAVQRNLKADEASVEFIHYRYFEKQATDSTMYAALVVLPGDLQPRFIPLFEKKSIDTLLRKYALRRSDYANGLYGTAAEGTREEKSLYELIWQPLDETLHKQKTIYFSPSGILQRINLSAIPIPPKEAAAGGETLADRYRFVELGSTRQLVAPPRTEILNQDAVLIGGVQYDMDSTGTTQVNGLPAKKTSASLRGELNFSDSDSTLRGGAWNYLEWTEKEVNSLEPIMRNNGIKAITQKGYAASEEAFKILGKGNPSPRILHIATHGFFFPDTKSAGAGSSLWHNDEPVFKTSDHPMIRSGLVLAGGNYAWKNGTPLKEGMEDGILTAYEISQMDLSNTELVVLSACETGLGDIEGNEGVYGLQRGFKIAGAKYLIMSLWQVPDFQTQELMTSFYKNWLEHKQSIPEAFRSAQKEISDKYLNPYFWAGFVLVE